MRTLIGKLVCVEPKPDFYVETDNDGFVQVTFKSAEQACNTPMQTRIALSVSDENVVSIATEYFKHV
jgi:phosphopantetheinyl transferase (holo-ACP synthase)